MRSQNPWTPDEKEVLTKQVIEERLSDPVSSITNLIRTAQTKCLSIDRRKTFKGLSELKAFRSQLRAAWKDRMAANCVSAAPVAESEPIEPCLIQIEVEKRVDYQELSARLDLPTLKALTAVKEMTFQREIAQIAAQHVTNGHTSQIVKTAEISILAAASPAHRKVRIAIIGLLSAHFNEVESRTTNLPVELRYVENNKPGSKIQIPISCEYVIYTRHCNHAAFDSAQEHLGSNGNSRLYRTNGGISGVVQKVFDIASLKPNGVK